MMAASNPAALATLASCLRHAAQVPVSVFAGRLPSHRSRSAHRFPVHGSPSTRMGCLLLRLSVLTPSRLHASRSFFASALMAHDMTSCMFRAWSSTAATMPAALSSSFSCLSFAVAPPFAFLRCCFCPRAASFSAFSTPFRIAPRMAKSAHSARRRRCSSRPPPNGMMPAAHIAGHRL